MQKEEIVSNREAWAQFRLSVIGHLLVSPPKQGELGSQIMALSEREWLHPVSKKPVRLGFSTIEGWYYQCKNPKNNPAQVLAQKQRKTTSKAVLLYEGLKEAIIDLHLKYPNWSHQLHYDNLKVLFSQQKVPLVFPSYHTIRRYRKLHGMERAPRIRFNKRKFANGKDEVAQFVKREVRSFESDYVNALWHLDFHHCSRKLLDANGQWVKPKLLAILDDHSRMITHLQWFFTETAQCLVHALIQAFVKCSLPRMIQSDNGSAMIAAETRSGLRRLGILHQTTLPYSPYQNGKQEVFFASVEGRLMPMLKKEEIRDLNHLNTLTHAWLEGDYHNRIHSKLSSTPKERFMKAKSVGRSAPGMEDMKQLFTQNKSRKLRKSDGTIVVDGVRFEIPSRFYHLKEIEISYASWDLSHVWIINPQSGDFLTRIFPLDLSKNANGMRRIVPGENSKLNSIHSAQESENGNDLTARGRAPLMDKYMQDFVLQGRPPAFIPKESRETKEAVEAMDAKEKAGHKVKGEEK